MKCSCLACLVTRVDLGWHMLCVWSKRRREFEMDALFSFSEVVWMINTCLGPKCGFLYTLASKINHRFCVWRKNLKNKELLWRFFFLSVLIILDP